MFVCMLYVCVYAVMYVCVYAIIYVCVYVVMYVCEYTKGYRKIVINNSNTDSLCV